MRLVGDWLPGGFSPWITLASKVMLLVSMMVRGLDYFTGDEEFSARRLNTVEAAASLKVWGAAFIIAATIGFIGMLLRRGQVVLSSHIAGWALYYALATGMFIDVVSRSDSSVAMECVLIGVLTVSVGLGVWASNYAADGEYRPLIITAIILSVTVGLLSIEFDAIRNATVFVTMGTMHALMAIGTAGRLRQASIIKEGSVL